MKRTAVVLFNLGGPDNLAAVRPFLRNLFSDPAIIGLPNPFRALLATLISRRRAPVAREIYARIGGRSPLLEQTGEQADGLSAALSDLGEVKVFIAMRYWHPRADATAAAVRDFAPDEVVLLPLYPQYSTTTTGSSLKEWQEAAKRAGVAAPTRAICCYPVEAGWVAAQIALIKPAIARASRVGQPRILFSAHGLPQKLVDGGDPYQWQVEKTAAAVAAGLGEGLDWVVCYQSRVGPLKWLEPATLSELERAGRDRRPVVVVPIAFVSEHSETLVELDIEYRHQAEAMGVPAYERVPAVATAPAFIAGLAAMVRESLEREGGLAPGGGCERCPAEHRRCALRA